jgi:hypothetical protein
MQQKESVQREVVVHSYALAVWYSHTANSKTGLSEESAHTFILCIIAVVNMSAVLVASTWHSAQCVHKLFFLSHYLKGCVSAV